MPNHNYTAEQIAERMELAQKLEDWRWTLAETFGSDAIIDAEMRKRLDEIDEQIAMLRSPSKKN